MPDQAPPAAGGTVQTSGSRTPCQSLVGPPQRFLRGLNGSMDEAPDCKGNKRWNDSHPSMVVADIETVLVNPLRSRRFSEPIGRLAKNDHIDAVMLSRRAATVESVPGFGSVNAGRGYQPVAVKDHEFSRCPSWAPGVQPIYSR